MTTPGSDGAAVGPKLGEIAIGALLGTATGVGTVIGESTGEAIGALLGRTTGLGIAIGV